MVETDPVSDMTCLRKLKMMDNVQSNSQASDSKIINEDETDAT
jgi:hypothetical protein